MPLSALPLGYCTNVHPGRTLEDVLGGLDRYAVPVQDRIGRPIAVGLWLSASVIAELQEEPSRLAILREALARRGLVCYTLNAFPYGDFHGARVKEQVYLPDWSAPERLAYTVRCAEALAELLPPDVDGCISTLPLGFKGAAVASDFESRCQEQLLRCAQSLAELRERSGRAIRLAIEPEPFCRIETTAESIAFFRSLWERARERRLEPAVREHLGLCYDVCHQAVEFEPAGEAIAALRAAEVRIVKVQISCAIEADSPAISFATRQALKSYVEPRYLHQTMARGADGAVQRAVDLSHALIDAPPPPFAEATTWRVHFHVPVDAERIGPLRTTRAELKAALRAIAALRETPHLEVETYTWDVLPGEAPDLVAGLSREIEATAALMREAR